MKKRITFGGIAIGSLIGLLALSQLSAAVPSQTITYLKSTGHTAWTIMALKSAGQATSASGISVNNLSKATDIERTILGVVAGGQDPYNFKKHNLVATLDVTRNLYQIGDPALLNDDAWGILAYYAAGLRSDDSRIVESKNFLLTMQNKDGGWGYARRTPSDSNDTAIILIALARAGMNKNSTQVKDGLGYLKTMQHADGGFSISANMESDSASTAWVISALQALGIDPNSWKAGSKTPFIFLESTAVGNGSYKWKPSESTGSPIMTAYVAIAYAGTSYPVVAISPGGQQKKQNNNQTKQNQVQQNTRFRFEGSEGQFCEGEALVSNALELVKTASNICNFSYTIEDLSFGPYVKQIGKDAAQGKQGWLYLVNWKAPSVGAQDYNLSKNDYVTWYYGEFDWRPLRLTITKQIQAENSFTVIANVEEYNNGTWQAASGAQVWVGSQSHTTDSSGTVTINLNSGYHTLKASKAERIRSQSLTVVVGDVLNQQVKLETNVVISKPVKKEPVYIPAPQISFQVIPRNTAGQVSFGQLKPGEATHQEVTLKNTGEINLTFTSTVTGDQLFRDYIKLNNQHWQNWEQKVAAKQGANVDVSLSVPTDYARGGEKNGDLIFWARP